VARTHSSLPRSFLRTRGITVITKGPPSKCGGNFSWVTVALRVVADLIYGDEVNKTVSKSRSVVCLLLLDSLIMVGQRTGDSTIDQEG
jgi:hypothetical protein